MQRAPSVNFRDALDVARRQKAKFFELSRTATLARLPARLGKRDEARAMLADIYGWFTESFDTADLKEAKALLDELNTFTEREHPLTKNLPASFEVMDELYLIELQEPTACHVLLTTELPKDPSPPGFGFVYDKDTSLMPDGKTRVLGYTRALGQGGVAYIALGHCHSPITTRQPVVDASVDTTGGPPMLFRGAWETASFEQLLRNGITWGLGQERAEL